MPAATEGYYDENGEYTYPDYAPAESVKSTGFFSGLVNGVSGILSKTVDSAGDALALAGANKIVGAIYPTGQQNPQQVAANQQPKTVPVNYTPYIVAGGAVVGLVLLVAVLRK